MQENSLTRKELIDYLIKMTDRKLSNHQRNGMTIWALLGTGGIVIFQLATLVPSIIKENQINDVIIIFTGFLNFIISIWNLLSMFNEADRALLLEHISARTLTYKICIQFLGIVFLIFFNGYNYWIGNVPFTSITNINMIFIIIYAINAIFIFYYSYKVGQYVNLSKQKKILLLKPIPFWFVSYKKDIREVVSWSIVTFGFLGFPLVTNAQYFFEHNVIDSVKIALLLICLVWLFINIMLQYIDRLNEEYILTQEHLLITSNYAAEKLSFEIKKLFGDADVSDWIRYRTYTLCYIYQNSIKNTYTKFSIIGKNCISLKGFKIASDFVKDMKNYSNLIKVIEEEQAWLLQFSKISIIYKDELALLTDLIENQKKDLQVMLERVTRYLNEVERNIE